MEQTNTQLCRGSSGGSMRGQESRSLSILIVDDDPTCRTLLKKMLEKSRMRRADDRIICVGTKQGMLEHLAQYPFDVLLLDLHLPDGDGLEMVAQVNRQYPATAIIVITGENDKTADLTAMSYGAQDYLTKGEFNQASLTKSIYFALERKKNQIQTQKALEELARAHKQLQKAQAQMVQSEKMASIGHLAAGVAHEMNTPVGFVASNFETLQTYLTKLKGLLTLYEQLCEVLEKNPYPPVLEKLLEIRHYRQEKKIDFILADIQDLFTESQEGLQRVTSIIQNLRDFSRIDQSTEMCDYDINDGIRSTLVVARNEIKYDMEVVTELGTLPKIHCHPGQINQVFLNILVNAAQAIRSQNRQGPGHIYIRTRDEGDFVVCEIEDDGPGIPSEILSKIFDPFFTTKPAGKGTGLGLSVSYDIVVSKHQGQILVDSEVGKGTKFTIKLPREGPKETTDRISQEQSEHYSV
ncbi:MAG TPA: ATP-binding protein [Anaerohalosphaeraceae bacterium]|nr:ATP-binding protein [Anaerohalosphaeraceae bacterium]HOL90064.1 ATP-binding protein [Anaerohalosphaeraceae bacterium]HPP56835.1 ATP-binding protein [Anaerohalosphaeraceae bacterium]